MSWVAVALVALATALTANVLLLGYGGTRHDPVGQLSPIANLPVSAIVGHARHERHGHGGADD